MTDIEWWIEPDKEPTMSDCTSPEGHELKPRITIQTSVMDIMFLFSGFECEKCGQRWDVGDLADALNAYASLIEKAERLKNIMRMARPHIGDEYQRSWPHDEQFDKMLMEYDALLGANK